VMVERKMARSCQDCIVSPSGTVTARPRHTPGTIKKHQHWIKESKQEADGRMAAGPLRSMARESQEWALECLGRGRTGPGGSQRPGRHCAQRLAQNVTIWAL